MHPISLRKTGIFNERREITFLDPDVFRLDCITAPTLVIHGQRDTLQPFSHGEHTAEKIPACGPPNHRADSPDVNRWIEG